ncbi:MAG: intein-containing protein [Candidatus Amesbacteria bacterium GW2011_GWB1_47_26]|uniref:Intein-containing protein n=1 Tax=Candidatus Amesbacteria bacterium GW2011_GWC2_45_19 TaxID=1618366 RepID=A0A0G1M300_9BACT|nr:MAG: intein-containing protein [Candidatus Amesbacteria bacterium GW2011_GWC2_45_19]KKU37861.1 MAG: intein-containing protein [Candidatus Amesbacteria bacterium GW2011_GWA1_46_35]KKU69322.1 MAG: intein-containing protein [Microgenomates group bacterium GW2011_GWC1_47_20]KKU75044.1 MAG: intein-containing protein [Candidatus Amesbacteria bacterium GW2011_GWB1_47_26]
MPYHSRKYFLNEDFFSSWTHEMAYVLGFWYADGHMRHMRSYRIIFSSKDKDHLINIRNSFTSNSPVVDDRNSYSLIICSKKLYLELSKLGGTPHKSTSITFPKFPEQFLPDFIRGYFDGDGSAHFVRYRHTKNGRFYTNIRSNFTSGSKPFLESIKKILHLRLDLFERKVCQYGPHQFKLGYGQKDTAKLLDFMYYPGHITSLARKVAYLPKIKAKI